MVSLPVWVEWITNYKRFRGKADTGSSPKLRLWSGLRTGLGRGGRRAAWLALIGWQGSWEGRQVEVVSWRVRIGVSRLELVWLATCWDWGTSAGTAVLGSLQGLVQGSCRLWQRSFASCACIISIRNMIMVS